jgi:hypothetical protein
MTGLQTLALQVLLNNLVGIKIIFAHIEHINQLIIISFGQLVLYLVLLSCLLNYLACCIIIIINILIS